MPAHDPELRRLYAARAAAKRLEGKNAEERRALTAAAVAEWRRLDLEAVDAEAHARGELLTAEEREKRAEYRRRVRMADLRIMAHQKKQANDRDQRDKAMAAEAVALAELLDDIVGVSGGAA